MFWAVFGNEDGIEGFEVVDELSLLLIDESCVGIEFCDPNLDGAEAKDPSLTPDTTIFLLSV